MKKIEKIIVRGVVLNLKVRRAKGVILIEH